jgi:hypothetical protein
MTTRTVYGPGGFDSSKPNNNVVSTDNIADDPREVNASTLEQRLRDAIASNRDYNNLAAPTVAQTNAQVKSLTRQMNALIRLTYRMMEGTD